MTVPTPDNPIALTAALREMQAENDWLRSRNRALATLVLAQEMQAAEIAKENKEPEK